MFWRITSASLLVLGTCSCSSSSTPPRPPRLPLCTVQPAAADSGWLASGPGEVNLPGKGACHDAADIQQAVRARLARMRRCYEGALGRDGAAKGTVAARFTIAPDGEVPLMCVATSEIQDAELVECLLDALEDVRFPPGDVGCQAPARLRVTYPLVFLPSDDPAAAAR